LFARPGQERSAEGPGAAAAILRAATDDRGGPQGAVWCGVAMAPRDAACERSEGDGRRAQGAVARWYAQLAARQDFLA